MDKKKAITLISAAVDNELSVKQKTAFFDYIKTDSEVRQMYERELRVKKLLQKHAKPAKLDSCKKEIILQTAFATENKDFEDTLKSVPKACETYEKRKNFYDRQNRIANYLMFAAAILMLAFIGKEFFIHGHIRNLQASNIPLTTASISNSFEYRTAREFLDNEGKQKDVTWIVNNPKYAEQLIQQFYDFKMTVPEIHNADIIGIVDLTDSLDQHFPMVEYKCQDSGQIIYLTAFSIDNKASFNFKCVEEAVNNCKDKTDYYITTVKNRHVVSWKWDNTWYAGISNHEGNTLASLVKPLNK